MNKKKRVGEILVNARGQLVGRYGQAILVMMMVAFLNLLLISLSSFSFTDTLGSTLLSIPVLAIVNLLMGVLIFGRERYFLKLVRGVQGLSPADLFDGIKTNVDKAICIQAVYTIVSVITELVSVYIRFFVPLTERQALIADYIIISVTLLLSFVVSLFFGLCYYLLADHPEYSVFEIFHESNRLMTGNRLRFIGLALRMIPLIIIGAFAFAIGVLWPAVIYQTAWANFYLDLIGEKPYNPLTDTPHEPEPDPGSPLLM